GSCRAGGNSARLLQSCGYRGRDLRHHHGQHLFHQVGGGGGRAVAGSGEGHSGPDARRVRERGVHLASGFGAVALQPRPSRYLPGSSIDLVLLAQQLHAQSGGSFDLTVGPLMALWGFHGEQGPQVPDQHQITQTMQRVGQQYLRVEGSQLCKDRPLELDISGIAAGYMIDRVAERLIAMGVKSYMVEITGELKAEGVKPGGNPWRIAVEEPRDDNRVAQLVLPLRGFGISTSGDYRNYFEHE